MLAFLTFLIAGHVLTSASFHLSGSYLTQNAGDEITLICSLKEKCDIMYWFRQNLGQLPTLVSTFYTFDKRGMFYDDFKDSGRFHLTSDNNLTISNLQESDTATYYCASSQLYKLQFAEGTNLVVKGAGDKVKQSPSGDTKPGNTVILNCSVQTESCLGSSKVHWFKQFEESVAGVLYRRGESSDQCGNSTESQKNSCVYNLPKHNESSEETGTYYCAVAACGHLLFGKGTKLNVGTESTQVVVLSAAVAFTSVLVILLALVVCFLNRRNNTELYTASTSYKSITETFKKGDILYYVAMEQTKNKATRRHQDDTWSECVYFNVQ
ncbi:hypothetical protein WMY93_017268 [Mugilogobius chulae]|uniref:Ig-like domain-containing protein n=1 Tax=Mugilogobius chulae TaxID=88201 RepID=A0AAW0NZC2_9GOBI